MKKGKLIVIDGTDGSGKATQVAKLKERLINEGVQVESFDFPQYYNNFFGKLIGECLAGEHGNWAGLSPNVASVVYAADRFESSQKISDWLNEGKIVILDRYVSSNQIHQGGKISDERERAEFMQWLDTMEHDVFNIPRPDLILYLDISVDLTKKLLENKSAKEKKKYFEGVDQHEGDIEHLESARESGLKAISENNNWQKIECAVNGEILSIDEIHTKIYELVKDFINE